MTFAITASTLLNVALVGALFAWKPDQRRDAEAQSISYAVSPTLSASNDYQGYRGYYEGLLARGMSEQETKPVLLARLDAEARQAASLPERPYWQHRDASQIEFPLRLARELDHVRAVLTDIYGATAERDPAFAIVFRPLGSAFPFLTSDQQIRAERARLEWQLSAVSTSSKFAGVVGVPQLIGAGGDETPVMNSPLGPAGTGPDLARLLGPEELFEYQLRESQLADQLRDSKVEFSEQEFRETFKALSRLETSMGDRDVFAQSRDRLRTVLGSRRFAELWATRDPLFPVIEQSCKKHSLTEDTILTVYEMFNDSQDRLLRAVQGINGDPQRAAQSAREERSELERRLSGVVGGDVAEDVLRAETQHMLSLTRSQRPVPR